MTVSSYPVLEQDVTADLWRRMNANDDGITDDYAGDSFGLTVSGDTATVAPGFFHVNGQTLENDAPDAFNLPPVTVSKVYQVACQFDPAKDANPAGPLSLVAGVKGSFDLSNGKQVYPLHEVTRAPGQVMGSGTVRADLRWWLGKSTVSAREGYFPPGASRGSFCYCSATAKLFVRDVKGGTLQWVQVTPAQSTYSKVETGVPTTAFGRFDIAVPAGVLSGTIALVQFQHATFSTPSDIGPIGFTWNIERTLLTRVSGTMYLNGRPYANANPSIGFTVTTNV